MRNSAKDKKEITLMTILANEATGQSRKLLKKYNKPDAISFADLEQKLAELYFQAGDKVQIEKEMAEIHPHSKWLLSRLKPIEATKAEEVIEKSAPIEIKSEPEIKSISEGCCNNPNCMIHHPQFSPFNNHLNFAGDNQNENKQAAPKMPFGFEYFGMIGMVGIITLGLIVVVKATK